jgi:S-adenosylmethionine:tRNA ribosyltransferase-isomerase
MTTRGNPKPASTVPAKTVPAKTLPAKTVPAKTLHRPRTRFSVPANQAAAEPPEARGLSRDAVRLLAATGTSIEHARFADLNRYLRQGDVLVVNTSATRAAAVDGQHARLGPVVVHFSTQLDDGSWVIELRTAPGAAEPIRTSLEGNRIRLPDGVSLTLTESYPQAGLDPARTRLWRSLALGPHTVEQVLARHGRPIRYGYLSAQWPLQAYQTVFADPTDPRAGAEMPSAGRPFSTDLVTRLAGRGVLFAPITLHAGVSSLESKEPPPAERYRVPERTAMLVNWAHRVGGRVIAVGTTATRALESAAEVHGEVHGEVRAADGWTELVLGPDRPVRVVDGLITGMHDPDASHLLLLEAVAGVELVQRAYDAALRDGYLWHEFGDSCLLIPRPSP